MDACEPKKIKVLGPFTFSVGDTTSMTPYLRGGYFHQVKQPKAFTFVRIQIILTKRFETNADLSFRNRSVNL